MYTPAQPVQVEEAILDVETFLLRQGIARAADARHREAAPQAESRQKVSAEAEAEAEAEAATERAARWEAERSSLEARLASLEEEGASVRREADEQAAEVEALKTQQGSGGEDSNGTAAVPPPSPSALTAVVDAVPSDHHAAAVLAATLAGARSDLGSARSDLGLARAELDALRQRLSEEEGHRQELERQFRAERERRESEAVSEARAAAAAAAAGRDEAEGRLDVAKRTVTALEQKSGGLEQKLEALEAEAAAARCALAEAERERERLQGQRRGLGEELASERRAVAAAERRADRLEERQGGLEKELEASLVRARRAEESARELDDRLQSENRRRQSVDRALHDAEAKLRELNRRDETTAATGDDFRGLATTAAASVAAEENDAVVVELRGQVSRARERAEILEERLDETARVNRRLEREVAEAVEIGARAEAELGAALAGERLRRDGELTEIKSVVDEMMTLDPSASGGGVAGISGDLFSPPRGGQRGGGLVVDRRSSGRGSGGAGHSGNRGYYNTSSRTLRTEEGSANDTAALPYPGVVVEPGWSSALTTTTNDGGVAAATARLAEAWSLLESSEAARRRLSEEVKAWAIRTAGLEEALAAAEATAEARAREARLLAASLQDARDGLAVEEEARREAEGRADALRNMIQAGGGSGGGVSPAGGGGGGDVARNLAGQVKALRSRVEELLERARDAEVREVLEKRGRKAAQRALRELTSSNGNHDSSVHTSRMAAAADTTISTTASSHGRGGGGGKRRAFNNASTAASSRRTPLGGVSANDAVAPARLADGGAGVPGLASPGVGDDDGRAARVVAADAGPGGGGNQWGDREGDAVWLREAEALLSKGHQDMGF
ncbi:unnamed protein product [Ectocarpus sp. CCAP 1310/34]|nr:unnamed protein product [Ectocarpus sp. CCAP 1310/34]